MRFYVKCVHCGRVAGAEFIDPESKNSEVESLELAAPLSGYIVKCPGCSEQQRQRNPPAAVRTEVASILTAAIRRSA